MLTVPCHASNGSVHAFAAIMDDDDEDDIFAAFGVGDLDEGQSTVAAKSALATPASPSTSDVAPQAKAVVLCPDLRTCARAEANWTSNHSDPNCKTTNLRVFTCLMTSGTDAVEFRIACASGTIGEVCPVALVARPT